jgi:PilZ domain
MVFKRRHGSSSTPARPSGDRRHTPRRTAGWQSRYLVADEDREKVYLTDSDFTECVVRDLSTAGAGLRCSDPDLSIGDRVLLDLQLGERHRASIKVKGEVRHAAYDDGVVDAGIEFVEVGDLERALLLRLVRDLKDRAPQNA